MKEKKDKDAMPEYIHLRGIGLTRKVEIKCDRQTKWRELIVWQEWLTIRKVKLLQHSDGFNWGYGGPSPAAMAQAIMLTVCKGKHQKFAIENYYAFKMAFIAALPPGNFECTIYFQGFVHAIKHKLEVHPKSLMDIIKSKDNTLEAEVVDASSDHR